MVFSLTGTHIKKFIKPSDPPKYQMIFKKIVFLLPFFYFFREI